VSDSEDGKTRPNANYKLSKPDNAVVPEEELVFYYNREHRLAKAPKHVQELYEPKKPNRFGWLGFVGILVADTPRKIMFFTIILMCVLIWLFSFFGFIDSPFNLDGNLVKVSATVYEGSTILVINKRVKASKAYTGTVDAAVSIPIQVSDDDEGLIKDPPVFYHRVFFTSEKHERYSVAVPFDSPELLVVLQTENKQIKVKIQVNNPADVPEDKRKKRR
jgi:hypothetical protein